MMTRGAPRPAAVQLVLAAAFVIAVLLPGAAGARILLTLHDFGAVGDGTTDDTKAFADAWKAACTASDNVVLNVPAGGTFQIWPLTLAGPCRNNIKLFISGNIVAPESPEDWGQGQRSQWLHFHKVRGLTVTGGGVIDGRGQKWWAQSSCPPVAPPPPAAQPQHHLHTNESCAAQPAPKAVHFEDCQGINVLGITVQNSQQYHLTFTRSSDVKANYLRVTSPVDSVNTNGIHIVDSYHVHAMHNLISTGDDCISIVGNCTDVRLRDISCGPGHGISIGTLGVNNSVDYVDKIKVDNLFISNAKNGVRIRTTKYGGGGFARKVKFEGVVMTNVTNPIIIEQTIEQGNSSNLSFSSQSPTVRAVRVEKINYINIKGTSASEHAVTFSCSDAMPCRHLTLVNVNLTRVDGTSASSYCRNAYGTSTGTVIPVSCLSRKSFVQQVSQGSEEDEFEEEDSDW